MFELTDSLNMAEFGLITDVPSDNTAVTAWSDSLNVRPRNNSVQGVNKFEDSFLINNNYNGTTVDAKPVAVTQWTPAGTNFLNIAYIIESQKSGEVGKGRVFVYNTGSSTTVEITSTTAGASFTINHEYPPQIFVFNEVLIVNPGTGVPQYISADATTAGLLVNLPGFAALAPTSYPRIMRTYKNRLIAMNWYDHKGTSSTGDDTYQPIDFVWSSNITSIGSLAAATWKSTTTNTAGDAFLTGTPGRILDGQQLGEDFIVYKTDSVVRVFETGSGLTLGFDSLLEDDGIYSTRCVADIGNSSHLVIGNYGVYVHDGRGDKKDIAKGVFQEALFGLVKTADKNRSFLFQQTRDKEVWFCFSSKTNAGGGCDTAFVYDYNEGKLHKRTLPNVLDIYEAEVNGSLKIFGVSPDTKQVLELSNTILETSGYFTIENKLGSDGMAKEVSGVLLSSSDTILMALSGTSNLNDTKAYTDISFNPSTTYKVDTRVSGRYLNLRITMDAAKNPMLTNVRFRLRIAGDR